MIASCTKCSAMYESSTEEAYSPNRLCAACYSGKAEKAAVAARVRHTPGPWRVSGKFYIHAGNDPFSLAEVKSCQTVPADCVAEHEANARLIAASPTMEEVLQEADLALEVFLEKYGDRRGRLAILRARIQNALSLVEEKS